MARWLTAAVLALLLSAWGCPPEPAPTYDGDYAFPHADDFDEGAVHGAAWKASPRGCDECHRQGRGGPDARTCESCHDLYPHAEGYDDPLTHGPAWTERDTECFACHGSGERRPAAVEDSACRDCHVDYPHRLTFARPEIHGTRVLDAGLEVCGTCHGEAFDGTLSVDGCIDCHEHFPHSEGYEEGEAHAMTGSLDNQHECTTCHGNDFSGATSGVACADCHEAYPHGTGYSGLSHREDLAALGEEECLACHTDGAGHPESYSCTSNCHGGGQ